MGSDQSWGCLVGHSTDCELVKCVETVLQSYQGCSFPGRTSRDGSPPVGVFVYGEEHQTLTVVQLSGLFIGYNSSKEPTGSSFLHDFARCLVA